MDTYVKVFLGLTLFLNYRVLCKNENISKDLVFTSPIKIRTLLTTQTAVVGMVDEYINSERNRLQQIQEYVEYIYTYVYISTRFLHRYHFFDDEIVVKLLNGARMQLQELSKLLPRGFISMVLRSETATSISVSLVSASYSVSRSVCLSVRQLVSEIDRQTARY